MSQTDYFNNIAYQPKYFIGDRVFGYWNRIPFCGTIGNDGTVDASGPKVTVFPDLPIKFTNKFYCVIVVKHKDIKKLVEMK